MAAFEHSVFRKYDIRGSVAEPAQLNPALAQWVGQSLGTYLPQHFSTERVFVGSDNRLSSPALKDALITGLIRTGMDVVDIGEVLTPTVYFASASYSERGAGVMITGSHLDTRYNGIKMAYGKLALAGEQIQQLKEIIVHQDFAEGEGELTQDLAMIDRHLAAIGSMVTFEKNLHVVLDAGNGLSGRYIPPLLESLGARVTCLYCEPDGTYPNHLPNPEDPEMTRDLEEEVVSVGADLGLAFDGDSDRCGFIDNLGQHIAADRLLALLARDLLSRAPGAPIVFDVKASQALPTEIERYGGVPVMWKSGHSLMKQKMNEIGSPLGGEVSGHLFIGENYYGFDDAPLVALKTLAILSRSDQSIAEIFADIPKLLATPEIILDTPDEVKFTVIEELTHELRKKYEVNAVDGARVQFEQGWGLVRASNTQPAITLRFEAEDSAQIIHYMETFADLLKQHPEINLKRMQSQIDSFRG
ncbi:MAG: phosphomannomutase/phosphoglucomutase [Anaerolineaceae bacterium]|nr:phosphomannomutase/phosphoglucomutase [Anaerolineaceae bacterium]MCY4008545.1 phosphomannomutase/phosphoglucomutase [Anaerolineaceae bacterium]MCY4107024.1 phosphomannomutase/phosphoglucomutase [Chloroflexota bacterium]